MGWFLLWLGNVNFKTLIFSTKCCLASNDFKRNGPNPISHLCPCYVPRYYLICCFTYDQRGVPLVNGGKIVANDIHEWNVIISHAVDCDLK